MAGTTHKTIVNNYGGPGMGPMMGMGMGMGMGLGSMMAGVGGAMAFGMMGNAFMRPFF